VIEANIIHVNGIEGAIEPVGKGERSHGIRCKSQGRRNNTNSSLRNKTEAYYRFNAT